MVGTFFRLKLVVIRNAFGGSGTLAQAGAVVVWMLAVGLGLGAGALVTIVLGAVPEQSTVVLASVFTAYAFFWLLLPLVAASFDQTLQPRSFELLPLSTRTLATGLAGAALLSPGAVFTVLSLGLGIVVGVGGGFAPRLVGLVGVAVFTVMMIGASRLLTTVLSDLLRRRRTRDIVTMVVMTLFVLPSLIGGFIAEGVAGAGLAAAGRAARAAVEWNPAGALGTVGPRVAAGKMLASFAVVLYGAVTSGGLVVLWGWALRRLQTTVVADQARSARGPRRLQPRWLPRGSVGAVAAKELVYVRRDIRYRAQLFGTGIVVVGIVVATVRGDLEHPMAPYLAGAAGFLLVAPLTFNALGFDGASMWGYVVAPISGRTILAGKNIAAFIGSAVLVVPLAVLLAWAAGSGIHVPGALLAAGGLAMLWAGIGNVLSVVGAYPMPDDNLFANRTGSWQAAVAALGGMIVGAVALAPVGLAGLVAWARWGTAGITAVAAGTLVYGAGIWFAGLVLGGRLVDEQVTRLVSVLDEH